MKSRIEEARANKATMNCAQAVACTYCDLIGVSREEAARLCSGMGGGMGTMEGTCGALLGATVRPQGIGTGKPLRACPDCVADAAEFLEAQIQDSE